MGGTRSRQIYSIIKLPVKYTFRKISELTGIPKSSVHRLVKAILKKNRYPESYFWETQEGYHWLRILLFAVIFMFGINCGIGAETISAFFKMLRLDMHIAVSPTTIRKLRDKMSDLLIEFKGQQEKNFSPEELLKVVAGVDETFFEKMILIFMDLSSGYIFF